jgi:hypothetical protein
MTKMRTVLCYFLFTILLPLIVFGQTADKTLSESETTHKSIPIVPMTDAKPVGDFKYPPFKDAFRKQKEMRRHMFEEIRKDVNAHLDKYSYAVAETIETYGDANRVIYLGYSDNPIVYQYLIKALHNENTDVVIDAVDGLRIYGDKRAIKELLSILDKNTKRVRLAIATTLFALGERKKSIETFTFLLKDSLLWREATYRLSDELGANSDVNSDAFVVLAKGIENQSPDIQIQALSSFMLSAGRQFETFHVILSALKDKRQVFRQSALEGILDRKMEYGPLSCKDALPLLRKLSKDENLDWDSRTRARVFAEDIEEAIAKEKK